jgi:aminoglycoside phosphotransferase (APT) family kinase protein
VSASCDQASTIATADATDSLAALDRTLRDVGLRDLSLLAEGLIFRVYRAKLAANGDVVVRIAKHRWHPLGEDTFVDTNHFLRHEVIMAVHARRHGIPTPEVYIDRSVDEPVGFTVSSYVAGDASKLTAEAFGELAARVHELPPPPARSFDQGDRSADDLLVDRICDQARSIEKLGGVRLGVQAHQLERCLAGWAPAEAVLHMDLRHVNLLARESRLLALIDWGNMLVGDPALEWARMQEFGDVTPAFAAGYSSIRPTPRAPAGVNLLYRFDTAVMLAAIHLQFDLGREATHRHLARVCDLRDRLARA